MTSVEITCILNVFKRIEYFEEQLNAVLSQSIPPKKVIIWNNNPDVNLTKYAKDNIIILNSSENLGVWARFFSQYFLLSGEFVCIFDDDTIPGTNWFKNCIDTINKYNALLGTIGVLFDKGDVYRYTDRVGWDRGSDYPKMVDIVGHSWFFRKEWITTFIKELPNIDEKYLTCGEDIHLSYVLQKYLNIPAIVPPHPHTDKSLWGADYYKSIHYGSDSNSISMQPGWNLKFIEVFKNYIDKGFETINNKAEHLKIYSNCLEYFINRIKNKKNFAIMKCADGEYFISINNSIKVQPSDDWEFKTNSILNKHFNQTLTLINSNVFYGVSGPSDSKEMCDYWYQNIHNTHNITFANIFVNKNYLIWENFLKNADYNCVLISQVCPSSGKLGGMKIIDYLSIDKYLVNNWDIEYEKYFTLVSKLARNHTNVLFFVSAGPLANIFIHRMYLENPNNTYIDCGSSIDVLTKGINTRNYQFDNTAYNDDVENLPIVYTNLPIVYTDLNMIKSEDILNDFEVVEFRFLTTDDEYDIKYEWWSRMYEYKIVLNMLENLKATTASQIHNTSWGFDGCHLIFKNDLDNKYPNSIHSDIKSSSIKNTMIYDITKPIISSFHNYFDFIINISTVEEVNYPADKILNNLLQQLKPNGYLIITFDYFINNSATEGNGSINLPLIENYLKKNIEKMPNNAINGSNVACPMIRYADLNCGILVLKKL
jgi:hypothetical protein